MLTPNILIISLFCSFLIVFFEQLSFFTFTSKKNGQKKEHEFDEISAIGNRH